MHTQGRANARSQGRSATNTVGTLLRATVRVCEHIRAFEVIDDPTTVVMSGPRVRIIVPTVRIIGATVVMIGPTVRIIGARVRMIGPTVRIIGARVLLAGTTFIAAVLSSSCGLASIFARYALT